MTLHNGPWLVRFSLSARVLCSPTIDSTAGRPDSLSDSLPGRVGRLRVLRGRGVAPARAAAGAEQAGARPVDEDAQRRGLALCQGRPGHTGVSILT